MLFPHHHWIQFSKVQETEAFYGALELAPSKLLSKSPLDPELGPDNSENCIVQLPLALNLHLKNLPAIFVSEP